MVRFQKVMVFIWFVGSLPHSMVQQVAMVLRERRGLGLWIKVRKNLRP